MNSLLKNNSIKVGIVILTTLATYLLFRIITLLFVDSFTSFLIEHGFIKKSLFPWITPTLILVNATILVVLIILFIFKKKYVEENIIKTGFKYAIIIHVLFFTYFFVMLLDAIFDLGLPHWYYF